MFNISSKTTITGYNGKIGTLQQALHDKNLHHNVKYDYFGKRVQRGTVDVMIIGAWITVRFDCLNGWVHSLEVI